MYNNEETRVLNQVETNPTTESRTVEDDVKNESKKSLFYFLDPQCFNNSIY